LRFVAPGTSRNSHAMAMFSIADEFTDENVIGGDM
jgi:hypothetical protein